MNLIYYGHSCFGIEVNGKHFIQCHKIIGMHYDSFPTIKIDHEKATEEFERNGKELMLMKISEAINI